jgi:hypothetical protein
MLLAHRGIRMTHLAATIALKAFPGGTAMEDLQRAYKRATGQILARITFRGVRRALNRGVPVLAVDSVTDPEDHVVVLYGYQGDTFFVHDPALFSLAKGFCRRRRTKQEIVAAEGDEFYAPRSATGIKPESSDKTGE